MKKKSIAIYTAPSSPLKQDMTAKQQVNSGVAWKVDPMMLRKCSVHIHFLRKGWIALMSIWRGIIGWWSKIITLNDSLVYIVLSGLIEREVVYF